MKATILASNFLLTKEQLLIVLELSLLAIQSACVYKGLAERVCSYGIVQTKQSQTIFRGTQQ